MLIFDLDGGDPFGAALAAELQAGLAPHEERIFVDGERKLRPMLNPRGHDVYVVHSLHGGPADSPHDKLCRLLMFVATLKEHGAARVTAVVPYLAYARKDRRTKMHDPVSLRYVAQMFEAVGTDQIIVLEAHNVAAFENAFRCTTVHLEAHRLFGRFAAEVAGSGPLTVASPDPGGVKRAQLWREALEEQLARPVGFAMVDKRRSSGLVGGSRLVAGEVMDATVLLLDDLIASGETMVRAAHALKHAGARSVAACVAHGLFIEPAAGVLGGAELSHVVVTDSVPAFRLPEGCAVRAKLHVVSAVALFANAIRASNAAWPG